MTIKRPLSAILAAAMLLPAGSVLAHHSFAAYDASQVRTLNGMVKTFDWANPHVTIKLVVQPDAGSPPQEWSLETSSPVILTRFGWTRDSLKPGDRVRIDCNPLSNGSHGGRLHTVVMLDTGQILKTKLTAAAATDAAGTGDGEPKP
jgi:hypothetical protein